MFKRKPLASMRKQKKLRNSQPVLSQYIGLSMRSPLFQSQYIEFYSTRMKIKDKDPKRKSRLKVPQKIEDPGNNMTFRISS